MFMNSANIYIYHNKPDKGISSLYSDANATNLKGILQATFQKNMKIFLKSTFFECQTLISILKFHWQKRKHGHKRSKYKIEI